ncbi:hypothetical protein F4778DRAFT_736268 [Xylariomycetidae sp. FL2044]|nr:hypothetical protein F4778DRAFT_736268 [Xylariomycetidae sp. FL2044]
MVVNFPQFTKLPLELRDQIWSYALPEARVFEVLDSPCASHIQSSPSNRLMFADIRNEPPPPIARVCQDGRQAVIRRYKPLVFSGTVKYLDLSRDIILLDSYLQVKRLLKVMRLLGQIESIKRNATRIALGTSWGLHTGLHLRLFHKSVQTQRNMAKFLDQIAKFTKLTTIILVVYQRSASSLVLKAPDPRQLPAVPWTHYDLYETYHCNFNVNFNFDNYWLRRPYQTRLVTYEPVFDKIEKANAQCRPTTKQCYSDPQPRGHQVNELRKTFEGWLQKLAEEKALEADKLPQLETATLTWVYAGGGGDGGPGP